jgi:hypothetical protein
MATGIVGNSQTSLVLTTMRANFFTQLNGTTAMTIRYDKKKAMAHAYTNYV